MPHRSAIFPAFALALWLLAAAVLAQGTSVDQRRQLIEQKLRLVESLVNSPSARASAYGQEAQTPALLDESRKQIEQVRVLIGVGDFEQAAPLLDQALRNATRAASRLGGNRLSESAQRESLANLREQVATYRQSLAELRLEARLRNDVAGALSRLDALTAQAEQLATSAQLAEANKRMAEAYRFAVAELSRLRAGETVVMSLNFDTPAQEYAYEQKRFHSNEILVRMMIDEGRAEGEKRALVDRYVEAGRERNRVAAQAADQGQHRDAVLVMEQANQSLNRALQTMGVPVF
jgi:hypothetical protein